MIGQNTIVVTDIFFVDVFYGGGDLFMDLSFLLGQDGIVDHLSCEGMLEDVGRIGIDASFIEEF